MGNYNVFVWGSFGLMLMAMGGELMVLLRRQKAQRNDINATRAGGSRRIQR